MPMTIPASPVTARSIASWREARPIEPVSSATPVASAAPPSIPPWARSPSIAVIERWCCWASTSVGASSAAWPPESTTCSIARSATSVLPDPTSPCSSRFIGWSRASSVASTSPISRWPAVSSKGRRSSNAASSPDGRPALERAPCARCAARRRASTSCSTSASSKRNRFCAAPTWLHSSGAWIQRSACITSSRP